MIGFNDFRFNKATMAEIVQHYFDTVLFKDTGPRVNFVSQQQDEFLVRVEALKPAPK